MDKETKGKITKIFDDLEKAMGLSLLNQRRRYCQYHRSIQLPSISARCTERSIPKAFVDGITDKITKDYKEGIKKGGSWCINPVYEDIGGGKVRATTRAEFVPWLDDFNAENRKTVMDIFIDGEKGRRIPA